VDPTRYLLAVLDHLPASVEAGHLVVDDADADMVGTRADIAVSHALLSLWG
jgi:hypothetical protein